MTRLMELMLMLLSMTVVTTLKMFPRVTLRSMPRMNKWPLLLLFLRSRGSKLHLGTILRARA